MRFDLLPFKHPAAFDQKFPAALFHLLPIDVILYHQPDLFRYFLLHIDLSSIEKSIPGPCPFH